MTENDDWTNGFWTGMLWMTYQYTGKDAFRQQACRNMESFERRLDEHVVLDHHDIGFLYSLSVGAGYRITGDSHWKEVLIRAADVLLARIRRRADSSRRGASPVIRANYRLIIDSLLNLPLLYRASELTGDPVYRECAQQHYKNVIGKIVREDYSTYHTFYFDPETGKAGPRGDPPGILGPVLLGERTGLGGARDAASCKDIRRRHGRGRTHAL